MEKLLKPYDKEYMRLAMLKHEETFKQQVYELHRLYRIQKLLMVNNQERRNSSNIWTSPAQTSHLFDIGKDTRIKLDLEQPAEMYTNGNQELDIIDESEIELTLGPTNSCRRKKAWTPPNSDLGPSFSSSSTGSSQTHRTILGTHHKTDKTSGFQLKLVQVPDTKSGFRNGIKNVTTEERLTGDKIENHLWMIHPLSLNMT